MSEEISDALIRIKHYIEENDYKGYDPYDALSSPVFKLPLLKSNRWIRFAAQQTVKRSPVNLRPFLQVKKGVNPVTLGLCIQAYSYLLKVNPDNVTLRNRIILLIDKLEKLIPNGFHGACWGYDFDWEARYARIRAYQPTVVATGIITHALFEFFQLTNIDKAKQLVIGAAEFVMKDLKKTTHWDNGFCYSYSPFDTQQVFNASMKGARILSQAYSLTGNEQYRSEAEKAVRFVVLQQKENGSWNYSLAQTGDWVDNYHTGYVLDCLHEYIRHTRDFTLESVLIRGFEFYKANFFDSDGMPKFYDKQLYPIDSTAAAQSLLTLCRFGEVQLAMKVARRYILKMQDKKGYFYFRKYKQVINKTSFMRWSNAWMFVGLARLFSELNERRQDK